MEMLPYNWQWAGICELYRNIRCTAAEATPFHAACVLETWWQHLRCSVVYMHISLSTEQPVGGRHPPRRLAGQQHAVGCVRLAERRDLRVLDRRRVRLQVSALPSYTL